ncbi:MAG: ATP-binding protein [Chloroflexota bacterium]
MFSKIQWRITFLSLLFSLIIMAVMYGVISRPSCLEDCVQQTLATSFLAFIGSALAIGYIVRERTSKPIEHLTEIADRISDGDINARVLPRTRDEVGLFNQSFNRMTESLTDKIVSLNEEQSQLATAVNYMADGVIITDERSYVLLINPAARKLLEAKEKKSLGRSFAEVVRHHQLIDLLQRCQTLQEEQTEAVEIGRELFLQTIVTPIQENNALSYLIILQNLTPIRRLQTIRRDFISNISHELRTPLASLRAVVETLQDHALEDPQLANRFLGRAEGEIDVMTQMVEELLELSKIESGQVPLKLEKTAVSALFLNPADRFKEMAERNEINLILNLPANLPFVLADRYRIHQVVSNLLHNAIKYTDPGGSIILHAATKSRKHPNKVILSVEDSGSGISKEDVPRIFERFYKSDRARTRQKGGTGLGLAICKHIVESHNGEIWVRSQEGNGSSFFFSLPQAEG